jgi:hypothetical protein
MMRMNWWLLILLTAGLTKTSAEPLKYLELGKSKPVEVNGFEFVAATQTQWLAKVGGSRLPIEVQLLITNRSGHDLVFRTFDTFRPILRNADGTGIPCGGGRDGTMASPPVMIRAGDTYCLSRKAELWWKMRVPNMVAIADGKGGTILWKNDPDNVFGFGDKPDGECGLLYWDGTGMEDSFEPLKPGHYSLSFSMGNSEKDAARESQKLGVPVWSGKAMTKEVPFEIVEQ